jgi:class 3 adenylate cyclase
LSSAWLISGWRRRFDETRAEGGGEEEVDEDEDEDDEDEADDDTDEAVRRFCFLFADVDDAAAAAAASEDKDSLIMSFRFFSSLVWLVFSFLLRLALKSWFKANDLLRVSCSCFWACWCCCCC